MPNFNMKDLMREAGSTISTQVSRVVQVNTSFVNFFLHQTNSFIDQKTEEVLNLTTDKTELDSHFEGKQKH